MPPKSRLGRGLGGLIANATLAQKNPAPAAPAAPATATASKSAAPAPTTAPAASTAPASASVPAGRPIVPALAIQHGLPGYMEIPVASIIPSPTQARRDFAPVELKELADSISAEGLLQPVVVRRQGDKYQLIAGERRWRAFQLLGIKNIPARISVASDASSAVLGLVENLQREGLNPIEEASGYASLIRDFKLTPETVAERVGKPRTTVANSLRLLQLDAELQGYVAKNLLSAGHAKVLLGIPNENAAQRALLARRIIAEGLSVRTAEKLVQTHKPAPAAKPAAQDKTLAADAIAVASIEKKLTSRLGARVAVQHTPKRGKIIIEYAGNEDLRRILEKLGVEA